MKTLILLAVAIWGNWGAGTSDLPRTSIGFLHDAETVAALWPSDFGKDVRRARNPAEVAYTVAGTMNGCREFGTITVTAPASSCPPPGAPNAYVQATDVFSAFETVSQVMHFDVDLEINADFFFRECEFTFAEGKGIIIPAGTNSVRFERCVFKECPSWKGVRSAANSLRLSRSEILDAEEGVRVSGGDAVIFGNLIEARCRGVNGVAVAGGNVVVRCNQIRNYNFGVNCTGGTDTILANSFREYGIGILGSAGQGTPAQAQDNRWMDPPPFGGGPIRVSGGVWPYRPGDDAFNPYSLFSPPASGPLLVGECERWGEPGWRKAASAKSDVLNVDETVKIYPNPARDKVNLASETAAEVEVFDVQGRRVFRSDWTGETRILVSGWPAGLYLFRIRSQDGTRDVKISVTR